MPIKSQHKKNIARWLPSFFLLILSWWQRRSKHTLNASEQFFWDFLYNDWSFIHTLFVSLSSFPGHLPYAGLGGEQSELKMKNQFCQSSPAAAFATEKKHKDWIRKRVWKYNKLNLQFQKNKILLKSWSVPTVSAQLGKTTCTVHTD